MNLIPYDTNFNFMRLRGISLAIAVLIMLVAIIALPTRGLNFALDFTGGTVTELKFDKAPNLEDLRQKLEKAGFDSAVVQTFGSQTDVVIRLQPDDAPTQKAADQTSQAQATEETGTRSNLVSAAILDALSTPGSRPQLLRSDFVGPQIGDELAWNGILAVAFVVIGFLVYISIRFEWKFAVAATITTMHDVIIVTGWFALTQHEFDLTVLAGVLSVMGYSINDTIVVFDRARENFKAMHRSNSEEILNRSVNQTLSRTIITSVVALLTVVALYLYGGQTLQGMAESQILGIVIGTLSSIFVACPLLLWLGITKQDLMPKARDMSELERRP